MALRRPVFDFRPTFVTLRPWKRTLSASDSGPIARRAKSDFLSVIITLTRLLDNLSFLQIIRSGISPVRGNGASLREINILQPKYPIT